jgi:hypothetical protein
MAEHGGRLAGLRSPPILTQRPARSRHTAARWRPSAVISVGV